MTFTQPMYPLAETANRDRTCTCHPDLISPGRTATPVCSGMPTSAETADVFTPESVGVIGYIAAACWRDHLELGCPSIKVAFPAFRGRRAWSV
jgi:hypothetical protein